MTPPMYMSGLSNLEPTTLSQKNPHYLPILLLWPGTQSQITNSFWIQPLVTPQINIFSCKRSGRLDKPWWTFGLTLHITHLCKQMHQYNLKHWLTPKDPPTDSPVCYLPHRSPQPSKKSTHTYPKHNQIPHHCPTPPPINTTGIGPVIL